MILSSKTDINRLVIYFFYDKDGIVDDYVTYLLDDVRKNCSELFVICNGVLSRNGRDKLEAVADSVMVRKNEGFDVWAYKTALDYYGWEKLETYDEVVMMNFTIMGPLYPFSEMFEEMNARNLDFWGINKYHKYEVNPFEIEYGYIPEHIQSHFIAVRSSMIKSVDFQEYWNNRPEINNYIDAVSKHEAIFTKSFSDKGFLWDVYVDTSDLEGFTPYPLMYCPTQLIKEKKCPVFKRRNFFQDLASTLTHMAGRNAMELLEYLDKETSYDVNMIWDNILRTINMADIKDCLDLNYVLPSHLKYDRKECKCALVMHLYFEDLIPYCFEYSMNMPDSADIIITTDTIGKCTAVKNYIAENGIDSGKVKVIQIENRGRDVSALLVGTAPYLYNYDLICFMHDKKVAQLRWGFSGYDFSERCFKNLLGSKCLVNNIISLFEKNDRLGVLYPLPPNHAEYNGNLGNQWGPNFEVTKKLANKLDIKAPLDDGKEVVAPLGTMFWFRPQALKKLIDYGWTYSDFPEEPNKIDGTILHAIERLYCLSAQDAGFFSATVMSDDYARTELTNLDYMARELSTRIHKNLKAYFITEKLDALERCSDTVISNENLGEVNKKLTSSQRKYIVKDYYRRKVPKFIWKLFAGVYRLFGKNNTDEQLLFGDSE